MSKARYLAFLSVFVLTIFVMRDGDLSFIKPINRTVFRRLYDYARPSSATCSGVSLTASYSEAEQKRALEIQTNLKKLRGGNPMETLLTGGFDSSDNLKTYIMSLIGPLAVWAAFFIIGLLLCICAVCNWCCMFGCCKNCKCCRCCKKPVTTKRKDFYMYASIFFMVGVFAAGIAGATFSGSIGKGMKVTYCSVLNFVEDLVYGQQSTQWLGINGVAQSLQDIINNFNAVSTTGQISSTDSNDLDTKHTSYTNVISTFDSTYTGSATYSLNRADPAQSGSYLPDFIQNLGPVGTAGKYTYLLQAEADIQYNLATNAVSAINSALSSLQGGSVQSSLQDGYNAAADVKSSMDSLYNTLDGSTGKTVNTVVDSVGKAVLGVFICYIIIAILPIVSLLLIKILKIKFFSKVLHVSWCLLGLLTILGFLISAIFYPVSIVFTELCEVLEVSITDGAKWNTTIGSSLKSSSQQAGDLTYTCLFGDGSALESLGVAEQVSYFQTIYNQFDQVDAVFPLNSTTTIPSTMLNYQTWYVEAVRDNKIPDSTTTATDLATLNSYVNSAGNTCTTDKDYWWLSASNCTDTSQYTYSSSETSATQNLGSPTCIGLNNWISSGQSGRYSSSDHPTSGSPTCSQHSDGGSNVDEYTYLNDFVTNFVNNRNTFNGQFPNVVTAFTGTGAAQVTGAHTNFGDALKVIANDINTVKTNLISLSDSLIGDNGIIVNTNCVFVGTDLRLFANAMCNGFISSIFQATIVLIIVSIFSFIGTIFVFCIAKRVNVEDNQHAKSVSPGY